MTLPMLGWVFAQQSSLHRKCSWCTESQTRAASVQKRHLLFLPGSWICNRERGQDLALLIPDPSPEQPGVIPGCLDLHHHNASSAIGVAAALTGIMGIISLCPRSSYKQPQTRTGYSTGLLAHWFTRVQWPAFIPSKNDSRKVRIAP